MMNNKSVGLFDDHVCIRWDNIDILILNDVELECIIFVFGCKAYSVFLGLWEKSLLDFESH